MDVEVNAGAGAMIDRAAIASLALLGLVGCADLHVRVDILNPSYVGREVDYVRVERQFISIRGSHSADVSQAIDELKAKHREAFDSLASLYVAEAAKQADPQNKKILEDSASDLKKAVQSGGEMSEAFERYRESINGLDSDIKKRAFDGSAFGANGKLTVEIQSLVRKRASEDAEFRFARQSEIKYHSESVGISEEAERQPEIVRVRAALRSPIPGSTIASADFAYFVASAPDDQWKSSFNEAFGTGRFGNADIAIKLGADGEFTVKGLSFDPSAVAAVASKVTTQALLAAAQISGVPVKTSSMASNSPSPGLLATGDAASTVEQQLTTRAELVANQRRGIESLMLAILHEDRALSDATRRDGAQKAIRSTFDAVRNSLSLDGY